MADDVTTIKERRVLDRRQSEYGPTPGAVQLVHKRTVQIYIFVCIIFVSLSVAAAVGLYIYDRHKAQETTNLIQQAQKEARTATCGLLHVLTTAPPQSPYSREVAKQAYSLASIYGCPFKER